MKKIAIYVDSDYNQGGVFQYTKSLIFALLSAQISDITLTILYTNKSWYGYLSSFINIDCVYLKKSDLRNSLYQFFIAIGCLKITKKLALGFDSEIKNLDSRNFDYIIFPGGDTIASLCNSKSICTIHDLMHRYERRFRESGGFFRYRYRENYYKSILKSSQAVLVDSELGAQQVNDSFNEINAKIFVLPYIAPDYIYQGLVNNIILPDSNHISEKYIFYPAQFWAHKNHINLLRALLILRNRGERINLVLSGSKNREFWRLEKFVLDNSLSTQVKFKGHIPDLEIINLYKNAEALVMPTFYGPTNIPPIEAILLGCPPIVSGIYAMPDQFDNAALYFDPNDPEDIAGKIFLLLKNKNVRHTLIDNGELIKRKFSQKRFSDDVKKIIFSLCK